MQALPHLLIENIFKITNPADFETFALKVFAFQAENNLVYKEYLSALGINPVSVRKVSDIPHLPAEFFKTHLVKSFGEEPEVVFTSSGTTDMETSRHFVKYVAIYERSFLQAFRQFYGEPEDYCILALLPSYMEREDSSLIYMTKKLIELSRHNHSGFYLHNLLELSELIISLEKKKQKTILLGVSFALLDLAEKFPMSLSHIMIMETGGMKGRRKELTREELHIKLQNAFGVKKIHSEYGMTELLSQAYSQGEGKYFSPPWMKISIRDIYDPFSLIPAGITGGVNITDLANIYSCSFIQTSDLGRILPDGGFEINGRIENSDIRGCNLMVE